MSSDKIQNPCFLYYRVIHKSVKHFKNSQQIVLYWPIPGRECILDVALDGSEARILGQDTEVRFPL
jgi:hypothetical protein